MKEQVIQIPDTLEIKEIKDGKIILVEKEKKLTYENISHKLFADNRIYRINKFGGIDQANNVGASYHPNPNNTCSQKQAEKLLAINKLMNVAKYLNGDWQPDWNNAEEGKYFISFEKINELLIDCTGLFLSSNVFFKSEELAKQAIEILGEKAIKLALCTDY